MNNSVPKIINDCKYCAKKIGKETISPNMLLHVLSLYPIVRSQLLLNGTNIWLLRRLLNPYTIKNDGIKKFRLSSEVKDILQSVNENANELDIFKECLKRKYVKDIMDLTGFRGFYEGKNIIQKYAYKIQGGNVLQDEIPKYEKINSLLNRKNIMIMGEIGSGRFRFLKNYLEYNKNKFSVYYFDLSKYFYLTEDRLLTLVKNLFDSIGDDYVYIPNFLININILKGIKYNNTIKFFENIVLSSKIFTKVNKENFNSEIFSLSRKYDFFSLNVPHISIENLYSLISQQALSYSKFYDIEIIQEDIRNIINKSNNEFKNLSQPGGSLKNLMILSLDKYSHIKSSINGNPILNQFNEFNIKKHLQKYIIGQESAIELISKNITKSEFLKKGIINKFIFQGEHGCGAMKTSLELSKYLFGSDSFRYYDFHKIKQFPYTNKIYSELENIIKSMYGGVLFLDNIDEVNLSNFDIIKFINENIEKYNIENISAPLIVIGYIKKPLNEIKNYSYFIDNFQNIVHFKKLDLQDLEKVAKIQIKKIEKTVKKDFDMGISFIGANINPDLNVYGLKKLISMNIDS